MKVLQMGKALPAWEIWVIQTLQLKSWTPQPSPLQLEPDLELTFVRRCQDQSLSTVFEYHMTKLKKQQSFPTEKFIFKALTF